MKKKILLAGPCSAESRGQLLNIAAQLKDTELIFRAGIWKPRTKPNQFEGVGGIGLAWMSEVRRSFGKEIITEVANKEQLKEVIDAGFNHIWIGARTVTNPFSVEEIAANTPKDFTVFIKNPMNPDIDLWCGAVERFEKYGITKLGLIHRGFSLHHKDKYRNTPLWNIAFEMMVKYPNYPMIGDVSHIAGDSVLIFELLQEMEQYDYDGYMIETHSNPLEALTDAKQQITPDVLKSYLSVLGNKKSSTEDVVSIAKYRQRIDDADTAILSLLGERFRLSNWIGKLKGENNVPVLDVDRYVEKLGMFEKVGEAFGLDAEFSQNLFKLIHEKSVEKQVNN